MTAVHDGLYRGPRWWVGTSYLDGVGLLTIVASLASAPALQRLVLFVTGLGFVLYGTLVMRKIGVELRSDGVVLHGPARLQRVAWEDVDHFSVVDRWPYQPLLVTRQGGTLKTYGLGAGFPRHRQSYAATERVVAELNDSVAAYRSQPS